MLFFIILMQEKFSNNTHRLNHYSNKGGHLARSNHWKSLRRLYPAVEGVPQELAWMIRRSMLRDPKSGR